MIYVEPFFYYRRDWRLKFVNLKNATMLNIMNERDQGKIWIPKIIFYNSPKRYFIKSDALSSISIRCEGTSNNKFSFEQNEYDEFQGNENSIIFENMYDLQLTCKFEFHFYPFDTQQCFIMVSIFKQIILFKLLISPICFYAQQCNP